MAIALREMPRKERAVQGGTRLEGLRGNPRNDQRDSKRQSDTGEAEEYSIKRNS